MPCYFSLTCPYTGCLNWCSEIAYNIEEVLDPLQAFHNVYLDDTDSNICWMTCYLPFGHDLNPVSNHLSGCESSSRNYHIAGNAGRGSPGCSHAGRRDGIDTVCCTTVASMPSNIPAWQLGVQFSSVALLLHNAGGSCPHWYHLPASLGVYAPEVLHRHSCTSETDSDRSLRECKVHGLGAELISVLSRKLICFSWSPEIP